jgi:hypothetical protein
MPSPTAPPSWRRPAALAVFLATVAACAFSLSARRQLGPLSGLTDEWHPLGANLAVHGVLGSGTTPSILRPPGYPAFVAAVLRAADPPSASTLEYRVRVRPLVYAAQAVVLAATAALLFLWLCGWIRPGLALAAGLALGLSPLAVAWVGLLHYTVLHVLGLVASMWALQAALERPERPARMVLTGVLLGLVTLVRPVTLLLPAFVLAALWLRLRSWGPALRATALFVSGMAVAILPWTARNFAVSGRLVPVNLQAGVVLWGATEKPLPWDADHYLWFGLGPELLRIHTAVTGRPGYDLPTFERYLPELEAAYRQEAWRNLRHKPGVYARNVARAAWAYLAQTSTALPRAFVRLQGEPEPRTQPEWFELGPTDELRSPRFATALRLLYGAITLLAAGGLALGVRARDRSLLGPVALAACVGAAHALTHLDLLHHYLRVPFALVLAFYGLDRLAPPSAGRRREAAVLATGFTLAAATAALTAVMLLSPRP